MRESLNKITGANAGGLPSWQLERVESPASLSSAVLCLHDRGPARRSGAKTSPARQRQSQRNSRTVTGLVDDLISSDLKASPSASTVIPALF